MLGHGYITIGSTTLPNPVDFSISYENNETENKSEAGTALVSVTRLLRRNISFTCQVTSIWRDQLLTLAGQNSTTLTLLGTTYNGRLRLTGEQLAQGSELCSLSNGLWTMQLTFIEN